MHIWCKFHCQIRLGKWFSTLGSLGTPPPLGTKGSKSTLSVNLNFLATILNLLAAILIFHWFVRYQNFKFESFHIICLKHAFNKNYNLKLEFHDVNWWISPNSKLCSSHFGLLAAILNCFACCFCVMISNLNIHDYKHVQIKQPVKLQL